MESRGEPPSWRLKATNSATSCTAGEATGPTSAPGARGWHGEMELRRVIATVEFSIRTGIDDVTARWTDAALRQTGTLGDARVKAIRKKEKAYERSDRVESRR